MARTARKALTTVALGAAVVGFSAIGSGTAVAETVSATNCGAVVAGKAGDQVTLHGTAVREHVRKGAEAAQSIVLVHELTIWPNTLANKIAKENLAVGTVPNARRATIGGQAIAAAVREELKGSLGLGLLPGTQKTTLEQISQRVAKNCAVRVTTTAATQPTQPQRPQQPAQPGQTQDPGVLGGLLPNIPLGPGSPPNGGAPVPPRDYSDIPVAKAPGADIGLPPDMKYPPGVSVPDVPKVPEIGILGSGKGGEQGAGSGTSSTRSAGQVQSLAVDAPAEQVQLPMLLAVVALAGVTAALVRTWVLRKAS